MPCVVPFCYVSSSYIQRSTVTGHSDHKDRGMCQVIAYKRLKIIENHQTFRPKKWLRLPTGGGHLLEIPTVRL